MRYLLAIPVEFAGKKLNSSFPNRQKNLVRKIFSYSQKSKCKSTINWEVR